VLQKCASTFSAQKEDFTFIHGSVVLGVVNGVEKVLKLSFLFADGQFSSQVNSVLSQIRNQFRTPRVTLCVLKYTLAYYICMYVPTQLAL
jgi:hypothetical protein